jgi:hypothetical protein
MTRAAFKGAKAGVAVGTLGSPLGFAGSAGEGSPASTPGNLPQTFHHFDVADAVACSLEYFQNGFSPTMPVAF